MRIRGTTSRGFLISSLRISDHTPRECLVGGDECPGEMEFCHFQPLLRHHPGSIIHLFSVSFRLADHPASYHHCSLSHHHDVDNSVSVLHIRLCIRPSLPISEVHPNGTLILSTSRDNISDRGSAFSTSPVQSFSEHLSHHRIPF